MKDIKKLTEKYFAGEVDVQTLAKEARKNMKANGMVKTDLLGWINEKELQRLVGEEIIRMYEGDYVFTTTEIDEYLTTKGGQKRSTGRQIRVLSPQAQKYLYPSDAERAKRAVVNSVADQIKDQTNLDDIF